MKKAQEKLEKQQVKKKEKGGEKKKPRIKAAKQQTLNQPAEVVTKSRTANVRAHRPK